MSSSIPTILKWSKTFPSLKKVFLYYNIYIRNFKFFFKNSQFGEDKKIIKLFDKNKKGTYVDIGCFHPIRQNNTFLMFKRGWKGINIDLNPLTIELFKIARPKDLNICAALSNKKETKTLFFDHKLSSLNTLSKNHTIFIDKAFGIKKLIKKKIKTNTFNNIINKANLKTIEFMNIDIEGHELEVLKTINFKIFDIKVICVEIVNYDYYSNKIKTNKNKIFNLLKKNGYKLKFKSFVNYIFVKKN
jgi:FkbM family methyltransferase